MEANKKLKIKEEPFDSENLLFTDSKERGHLNKPYQEVSENIVKKEIPEISDDLQYENCDDFENEIGVCEPRSVIFEESLIKCDLDDRSRDSTAKRNLAKDM
jgi:hypothetical protein